MSMAWRPRPAAGPRAGRPSDKDPAWRRQNRRCGYTDESTRPVNRRVHRITPEEQE